LITIVSIHWGFSLGGVGKYAQLIDLVDRYEKVKIFSICILGKNWWYDKDGLKRINADKIFIQSRLDLSWIKKVIFKINKISPTIIMTHGFNGHFVALITRIFIRFQPVYICSYHGSYHAITKGRKIIEKSINFFTESYIRYVASSCVAVADFTKKYLLKKKILQSKISVIHNGISEKLFPNEYRNKLRDEWEVKENELLIGVASRLDPVKGLEYLLAAFKNIIFKYDNLKLVIIGTGSLELKLKKMVKDNGLSTKVIFTGFRNDIPACLQAINIFVLPSLAEYHSIALLEAMRAGKAIVATDVGGNTESVRNLKEGLIVPSADSESLAQAIEKMVNDYDLADDLGNAAKERFNNLFTDDTMIRNTARWLLKCANQ
jgi:glycosyltransferase involved in cell wall biosynthesis